MRPAEAAAPARPDNIRVTRRGWRCRVGPKPLGDLGRDAGFEAVAGQLEGETAVRRRRWLRTVLRLVYRARQR
jgi:hypothetical protein